MRGRFSSVICVLSGVLLGSCTSEQEPKDPDGPWRALVERPCPEGNFLSWENFGDPFFRNWCTGCHASTLPEDDRRDAPIDVNFDSLDSVRGKLDHIWLLAADGNRTMPPAGGPSHAERELLGEWLACGAPSEDSH